MIDQVMVKWTAEKHLRSVLKDVPHVADYVINDKSTWLKWIELLTHRLNECNSIGLIKDRNALIYAIESWTTTYATRRLEKSEFSADPQPPA